MIDDELKDALRVDPSPEFLARVRTRIANEPVPSAWRWSWSYTAAVAIAAALAAVLVLPRPPQNTVPSATPARSAQSVALPAAEAVAPAAEVAAPRRSANRLRQGFGASAGASVKAEAFALRASVEPDILLDPRETRALRALIAGVRDGSVDLTPVQAAATPRAMELEPVADIVIAPITIDPIAPMPGAEGVRP